jgi:hypothetical protein
MLFGKSRSSAWVWLVSATVFCAATMVPSPARAAFHLWSIQEIYSNSSGSLQFIELVDSPPTDPFGFQNAVNGMQINVSNAANTQTNTFTIPGNPLSGNTLDHMLLFGTAGIQAAGAPAPDYIIPNNFLFTGGGTVSFFGANSGPYSALPTDGILSRTWNGGDAVNSPTNYAGQTGTIVPVPEPSTMLLTPLAAGLVGLYHRLRRRRARVRPPVLNS